jgi:hypothetical protein
MPLAAGTRLGPCEVPGLIHARDMGEVYMARGTRLDRRVAIELLPAHVSTGPERRARVERVAKTTSALNHPLIRTLHDVGEQDAARFSGRCRTWRPGNSRGSQRMRGLPAGAMPGWWGPP